MEKPITIIGAGPVGSLLAIALRKRGIEVVLYERRPDLRRANVSAGKSINLAVSVRGIYALEKVGVAKEVLSIATPMLGRRMHSLTGDLTFHPYGKDSSQYINSISRGDLNRILLEKAEKLGAEIHFEMRLVGVDLERRSLTFRNEKSGETKSISYDRLIGTDGSGSVVRNALGAKVSESLLDYGYKELLMPKRSDGGYLMDSNSLHIWPRGNFMLIALPNLDGSFTCTLFLPFRGGDAAFDRLANVDSVAQFFEENFPDAANLIPDLPEQFQKNPTGQMVTVRTRHWNHKGEVLILGDAAHAIVPFFGQGMNAGFEDVTLLMERIDESSNISWEKIYEEFSDERPLDTDAIADMALDNFIEMRDKVGKKDFLLRKEIETALLNRFPGKFWSRYQLVTFSRIPYRTAQRVGAASDQIVEELSSTAGSGLEIDFSRASVLVDERISPLLSETL